MSDVAKHMAAAPDDVPFEDEAVVRSAALAEIRYINRQR